jgi:hypothetical protein
MKLGNLTLGRTQVFAWVLGDIMVVLGIVGFIADATFASRTEELWIFDVNGWHNVLYIVIGALGSATALMGRRPARVWCLSVGWLLLILGAVGIYLEEGELIFSALPTDTPNNVLRIVLGGLGIAVGLRSQREMRADALEDAARRGDQHPQPGAWRGERP